jgi:ribosome-binding ATPase YchF (GTP1/OBG family)
VTEESDDEAEEEPDCESHDWEQIEKTTTDIAQSFLAGDCAEEESTIEAALYYVEQAKVMRELAQHWAQEAKDDIENCVLHTKKRYCLVCDYAQNLGIPHFGKE